MSTSLVRRSASNYLIRAARVHPYFKYANAARMAYKTVRRAMPYVKMARRAILKRKRLSKPLRTAKRRRINVAKITERVGSSNAKRCCREVNELVQTRTLSGKCPWMGTTANRGMRLMSVEKWDGDPLKIDGRNTRVNPVVNFRGIKICMNIERQNLASFNKENMFFNWAIISPKAIGTNPQIPNEEFFRGTGEHRFENFNTSLSGLDTRCLPINTDKYIIHRHQRLIVGPYDSTEGRHSRYFEKYIKVNRQVRYNEGGSGTSIELLMQPEGADMWLVYWCSFASELDNQATTLAACNVTTRIVQYFREPKP